MSIPRKNEQGEALATFAESSRSKLKMPEQPSTQATKHTAPIPTDPGKKDVAATKVLAEGATGTDQGVNAHGKLDSREVAQWGLLPPVHLEHPQ